MKIHKHSKKVKYDTLKLKQVKDLKQVNNSIKQLKSNNDLSTTDFNSEIGEPLGIEKKTIKRFNFRIKR